MKKIVIELESPEGNAYNLIALAKTLAIKHGLDWMPIFDEMTASNYDNLLEVFMKYFNDEVILTRYGSVL